MTHPIVVGVDTTAESLAALDRAVGLAQASEVPLIAVHVRHEPAVASVAEMAGEAIAMNNTLDEIETQTRQKVSQLMAGRPLDWRLDIVSGDPGNGLIQKARDVGAGTIVVGGRNHGVVGGLVLGSVAQKLVRKSPVSVLVVRGGETHRVKAASNLEAGSHPLAS